MPSTNHSAIDSPGCWRAMIQIVFAPGRLSARCRSRSAASPIVTRSMSRPSTDAPSRSTARERRSPGTADQRLVALERIRLEVGVPHRVALRRVLHRHHGAVVARRHAKPVLAIVRRDRAVVLPALGVGARAGVLEAQRAGHAARTGQPEVEPLPEVGVRVFPDAEREIGGGAGVAGGEDFDCAGIECAGDGGGQWSRPVLLQTVAYYADVMG